MLLYTGHYFRGWSKNVCNWPVPEWSREQIAECVRIFHEEYVPLMAYLSPLVRNEKLEYVKVCDHRIRGCDDVVDLLWTALQESVDSEEWDDEWTHIPHRDRLVVCDSSMHAGYIEDPFPFEGATNGFGEPTESMRDFYTNYLPSMMRLVP
jgi:hypothetical protein